MEEKIVLFLGNGINNFSSGYSWNDLLKSLCRKFKVDQNIATEVPLTILYEHIFFKSGLSFKRENSRIKKFIVDKLNRLEYNSYHEDFVNIENISDIITTNYDFNLESASGLEKKSIKERALNSKESKYSLYRYIELENNKKIWHIHGNLKNLSSIILGYEHYVGQIEKIRKTLTKPIDDSISSDSWIQLFLNKSVYILGFGFNFSENDIWWLLSYRRRGKNYRNPYNGLSNKIVLLVPYFELTKNQYFYRILNSYGIHIMVFDVKDYRTLYKMVSHKIKSGEITSSNNYWKG